MYNQLIILEPKSVHVHNILLIFPRVFTCKVTRQFVWGKLKNPSNFLTQVAMNTGLALKEHHRASGYKGV